jgi:hypothetical protein
MSSYAIYSRAIYPPCQVENRCMQEIKFLIIHGPACAAASPDIQSRSSPNG